MPLTPGTRLGRYEIQDLLGEGGMGEVYRAEDTKLGRPVALKVLPGEVAGDAGRMRRFVQEARLASSLNHPHIITVHEIEDAHRPPYIAAEFIDGETLRARMRAGRVGLADALRVCEQIASALAAAHEAGVAHRDIKPDNVMIRRDGYVKVLDFGLAKLTERPGAQVDAEAQTRALVNTDPGAVMGTVAYMSPEQAAGRKVDARTDIFSLGVVLYEMLTGRLPFAGPSIGHVFVAIQEEEQPPLSLFLPGAPEALQEIVNDALAKDPDARPTAKQLLARLGRLRGRLDSGANRRPSAAPGLSTTADARTNDGSTDARWDAASTPAAAQADDTSSAPVAATGRSRAGERRARAARGRAMTMAAGVALLAVAIAAVAFAAYRLGWLGKTDTPSGPMKITRLTSTGQASDADISPDGKYVVHVKTEGGRHSLWLRQVETTSDTQIVAPSDEPFGGITFSRDGAYIYFARGAPNSAAFTLYQIPLLGGPPRKISDNLASRMALSPDGSRLAFRRVRVPGESFIVVAAADGAGERVVALRRMPNMFGVGPSWSPDGRSIAVGVLNVDEGGTYTTLVEVDVEGGAERRLTAQRWSVVGQVEWLPDKRGLVFTATEEGTLESQIWHVSYPGGEARKVTNDLNNYFRVGLTADAGALVTVQSEGETNVWVAPAADSSRARQITSGRASSGRDGLAWTPDGRVVYTTREAGVTHIWIADADGANARPLTARTRSSSSPSVTPDGRHVVFRSIRTGTWDIWRMNLDGGDARQLTEGATDGSPRPSADGRWVIFTSNRAGLQNLWKVSIDGGDPVRLTNRNTFNASVSPDGRLIACHYREGPDAPMRIALIPAEGGDPVRLLDFSQKFVGPPGLRWSPDGRALLYAETQGGVSNVWSLPVEGGEPKQLTDFEADEIFWFDLTRDGSRLALSRGSVANDVVLITDFR